MKAIISSTHDDLYQFFIPITTWCWNKIGIDVICFMPFLRNKELSRGMLLEETGDKNNLRFSVHLFSCDEDKEATYAQCSRLYAAALEFPKDDWLITADVDMAVFNEPDFLVAGKLGTKFNNGTIVGADLVPEGQYPMCYALADVEGWRNVMKINGRTYQRCLDDLLEPIQCEGFRGNMWSKDQEELYNGVNSSEVFFQKQNRARPGTQFAMNRIDRDDAFFMDRLSPDIVDYHMHRSGYTDENFEKILAVIQYFYPHENLTWMREYRNEYIKLL